MKLSFLMFLLLVAVSLQAQQLAVINNTEKPAAAVLQWEATEHSFGEIKQGAPVSASFSFTNTSNVPLRIKEVKGSCGCTVTTYTKEAIAPGARGQVTATYNAAHPGAFRKTVSVTVNTQAEAMVLTLLGTVIAKE